MKLLDLFCCAGGAAMGYYQAGFEVVGVDCAEQPRYPFEFHMADALEFAQKHGKEFDVIHASPPCQGYSITQSLHGKQYPLLIEPTRELMKKLGRPYVIENVIGAPLLSPVMLCGTMFGLKTKRHRIFECCPQIYFAPAMCQCSNKTTASHRGFSSFENGAQLITVAGHNFSVDDARVALGIDWMTQKELAQAIPPAYTKWIGERMLELISRLPDNASGVSVGFDDEAVLSAQAGSFSLNPTQPHKQGD